MGQKVNPNIFRLGINKTWDTIFLENKNLELPVYTFKNVEIKEYIQKFLLNHNLKLHSYKLHYNQSLINIYISYFIPKTFNIKKNKLKNTNKSLNILNENLLIKKFIEGLNMFTKKKHKIVTVFQCINKNLYFLTPEQINFLKTRLILLKKFKNKENFDFDETFDIICNSIFTKNSSFMLSNFIAEKLKKIKKHNRFLSCITKIFELLIFSQFSKIKGIKIKISGKLNRARRTKTKIIQVGNIPAQTIKESLNYSQSTVTHNPNGSFGVKVWIVEK